jgi:hypothetical protein
MADNNTIISNQDMDDDEIMAMLMAEDTEEQRISKNKIISATDKQEKLYELSAIDVEIEHKNTHVDVETNSEEDELIKLMAESSLPLVQEPFIGSPVRLATVEVDNETLFAAKELAATVFEIAQSGKITDAIDIVIVAIKRTSGSKQAALIYLYALTKEIASLDPTGETSVAFLSTSIIMEIYKAFGDSVNDTYAGTASQSVKNSKAYLVDAFINEFYPLYQASELEAAQGMSFEMMYPDRFLNILFSAVQRGYQNDLTVIKNLSMYHKRIRQDHNEIENEYAQDIKAIKAQHEAEDAQIMDLFSDREKADMNKIFSEKLREIMGQGVNGESIEELKRIISVIPEQIKDSISFSELFTDFSKTAQKASDEILEKVQFLSEEILQSKFNSNQDSVLKAIEEAKKEILERLTAEEQAISSLRATHIPEAISAEDDLDSEILSILSEEHISPAEATKTVKQNLEESVNLNIESMITDAVNKIFVLMEKNNEIVQEHFANINRDVKKLSETISEVKIMIKEDRDSTANFIEKHNL